MTQIHRNSAVFGAEFLRPFHSETQRPVLGIQVGFRDT